MGFLDGLLNPTKNTTGAYKKAGEQFSADTAGAKSFYSNQLTNSGLASNKYADALGLNGVNQQQDFQDAFMTGPAYEANRQAGIDSIDQSAVAGGMGQSGSTMKSLLKFGQDQYANEYQQYLDRLMGQSGQGYGAAAGQAGISGQQQDYLIGGAQAQDEGNGAVFGNLAGLASFGAGMFAKSRKPV